MSFKRFFQLFVFYALSITIAYLATNALHIQSHLLKISLMTLIGYVVLGLPLTLLSFKKKTYK